MNKNLYILIAFAILVLAWWMLFVNKADEGPSSQPVVSSEPMNAISVRDQKIVSNDVTVKRVSFKEPGYIVIHLSKDGKPGKVIGHSDLYGAGSYSGVAFSLDDLIVGDNSLFAMLHTDDGDGNYEFPGEDLPTKVDGAVVVKPFSIEKYLMIDLSSQNDSGESGTATITEEEGKAKVVLSLSGSLAAPQPAHIHTGSCADLGGVKYPLTSPVSGVSETMLDVSANDILSQLPLAINVHKSVEEISTYVACGDIAS